MPAKPPKDHKSIKRKPTQNNRTKPIKQQQVKAPTPKPPESSEKLHLFYLNKLKSLFSHTNNHPEQGIRENSAIKMNKLHREHYLRSSEQRTLTPPSRYTSSNPPRPHEGQNTIQSEVYRVVTAAINYGFANNVLEKKGDCFTFKTNRGYQRTPGQRYCNRCGSNPCPEKPFNSQIKLHNIAQGRVEKNCCGEVCSGRRFGPQDRFVRGSSFRYRARK